MSNFSILGKRFMPCRSSLPYSFKVYTPYLNEMEQEWDGFKLLHFLNILNFNFFLEFF
jgi:hypothetical protein